MDYIHVENLSCMGTHGAYEQERTTEQEFNVSIRLGCTTHKAGTSDVLVNTIDYQTIKNIIQRTIEGGTHYLVETLAEKIAAEVLKDKRIASVELTIKKMAIWSNGVPGVTIVRTNYDVPGARMHPNPTPVEVWRGALAG